ncbi:hypothetical protein KTT_16010 [Tengunoibacter tsumagoiensis]|uniref:Glycoside hydrolase family 42 N-terminal domain-containing protein n=2 Tax=Tengunoibacter tsumagoiensis TaxID=2014871 RepID=A0A401ZY32_9CHLR|nr:hypothetical protein KTT_16010 [Tengunoibacter tsumagoiensis]
MNGTPTPTTVVKCLDAPDLPANQPNEPIQVQVNQQCSPGISQYQAGLSQIDNTLLYGDAGAMSRANNLMKGTLAYENIPLMAWGGVDPWPDPGMPEPSDWSSLDQRVMHAVNLGLTPVITLAEAPWWMKGQLQGDGSTRVMTAKDEWDPKITYGTRILDNKMDAWVHLVQRTAERYMAPPYNVRIFQVWNELKGYFDPKLDNYDFTISPGRPDGPNASHGYTYMYNRVYAALMQVAQSKQIDQTMIKVGGPYVFMDTWSSTQQSDPSNVIKKFGVFDQRPFDVIQYWLQHKTGAGFITIDGSIENRDTHKLLADPFTGSEIYGEIVKWIRGLNPTFYPGSTTLPIWLAEWFTSPYIDNFNDVYDNAVKSYAMVKFIAAGGSVALSWGGSGDGSSDQGYWSPTNYAGGGVAHPWYDTVKALSTDFGVGKVLYAVSVSDAHQVAALATDQKIIIINKTDKTLALTVNGTATTLTPYQVLVMDSTHQ